MKPAVSVVIPHYNRPRELAETLASLKTQTLEDWEAIIVDDASRRDPSAVVNEILGSQRGRVVRHPVNRGPSAARNTGVAAAKGEFVAFLDSDDRWHPEKLEKQMAAVERQPDPEAIFCVTKTVVVLGGSKSRCLPARPVSVGQDFSEYLYVDHGFAQTSSFLLHRRTAASMGFAEELRQYEDHLFFITAGARGLRYLLVDEPLVTWRNDDRADRSGRRDDLERARRYLELAGPLLTPRARLAFRTRYLGRLLFWQNPAEALRIFHSAFAERAVGPRDLATLAARCAMPVAAYEFLRRSLAS
jgi:glycosyltransferase involved in cell wall biosynthesis